MSETLEDKKEKMKKELDKYEESAAMFHHLSQIFRKKVYELANRKKRAPVRVLEAMLFQPIEEVTLNGKEENNLLDLCSQIIYHKSMLMEYVNVRKEERENNKEGELNE